MHRGGNLLAHDLRSSRLAAGKVLDESGSRFLYAGGVLRLDFGLCQRFYVDAEAKSNSECHIGFVHDPIRSESGLARLPQRAKLAL